MLTTDLAKWQQVTFRRIIDSRGSLGVIEGGGIDLDFEVARVYFLYDVPVGAERAGHAHRDLHQVYIAMSGSFDVHLTDGISAETITLSRPDMGLLIRPGVWRTVDNFSSGAVCFVLASAHYSEDDYIRNYDDFCEYVRRQRGES